MAKRPRMYAYVLRFPGWGQVFIIRTDSGWWNDMHCIRRLIEGILTKKTLKEAWEYAGIDKRQWRYFIQRHPLFDMWRKDSWQNPGVLPEIVILEPETPAIEASVPEELVRVHDDAKVEIISFAGLLGPGRRRRTAVHIHLEGVILLPASPTQPVHYICVGDSTVVKDRPVLSRMPDMDGMALERAIGNAKAREAQRVLNEILWREQHRD